MKALCFVAAALLIGGLVLLAAGPNEREISDGAATVIGVVCGILAGLPTSFLLLVALSRGGVLRVEQARADAARREHSMAEPVIIIRGPRGTTEAPGRAMVPGYDRPMMRRAGGD